MVWVRNFRFFIIMFLQNFRVWKESADQKAAKCLSSNIIFDSSRMYRWRKSQRSSSKMEVFSSSHKIEINQFVIFIFRKPLFNKSSLNLFEQFAEQMFDLLMKTWFKQDYLNQVDQLLINDLIESSINRSVHLPYLWPRIWHWWGSSTVFENKRSQILLLVASVWAKYQIIWFYRSIDQ